ncbi:MAG: hypothetical protein A2731_01735 [Candidatus Buchananbacteria bacterium RIFCSPHIGHO2_01_FULL_39_8]|uniref:Uncharacterized protein n=1 Tax=Candidatus Buchananbacteria bacterium RIFCSPHIGHO2_01_FULL_39_8 TaxID=1797533 RepID=A0A1G1XZ31_9BACT|nr:MAG: hypothetical protein A2731_01735 [Candidatus Buchananbacteria bacterium RIFCSPHIGHO2_01_FULL_39_8]
MVILTEVFRICYIYNIDDFLKPRKVFLSETKWTGEFFSSLLFFLLLGDETDHPPAKIKTKSRLTGPKKRVRTIEG